MNRRRFLQTSTTALAMPQLASAAASTSSLGFSLYGMKTLPLEMALRTCAEIGYKHVELALNAGYPTEPKVFDTTARKQTKKLMKELGLELPCLMINISLTSDEKGHQSGLGLIAEAAQMAYELNPESPPLLETVMGGKPATWEDQKAGMVERLKDWASAAEKAKITIAVKAHVGSAVNSPDRLLWMLKQVSSPFIVAAYDYSHFELQGIDMEQSMQKLLPHTKFIHVKDSSGDPGKFKFLLPGEGRTDYVKYFRTLKRLGYNGPVCVEVSGQVFNAPDYDPVAAAQSSFASLSKALAQAT